MKLSSPLQHHQGCVARIPDRSSVSLGVRSPAWRPRSRMKRMAPLRPSCTPCNRIRNLAFWRRLPPAFEVRSRTAIILASSRRSGGDVDGAPAAVATVNDRRDALRLWPGLEANAVVADWLLFFHAKTGGDNNAREGVGTNGKKIEAMLRQTKRVTDTFLTKYIIYY